MATNNLIGVSGKINSGKDLVGRLIQLLDAKYSYEETLDVISNRIKDYELLPFYDETSWEIKKFADKLKEMVCMLIGCTRAQLEDREFKEKVLGEEWWYYKGETGLFPYNTPYAANKKLPLIKTTPRLLLQLLGTQCGRDILHPNIWINALFANYKEGFEFITQPNGIKVKNSIYPNWIITDVRFPNEAKAIKDKGGIVIRINRPCKECGGIGYHKMACNVGRCEHKSEYALDNYEHFDHIIDNDGTIEELLQKVKNII